MNKISAPLLFALSLASGCDPSEESLASEETVYADLHTLAVYEDGFTVARAAEPAADADERDHITVDALAVPLETADGCWVVLDYCSTPGTGGPSCTFTGCTISRALSACISLISETC